MHNVHNGIPERAIADDPAPDTVLLTELLYSD